MKSGTVSQSEAPPSGSERARLRRQDPQKEFVRRPRCEPELVRMSRLLENRKQDRMKEVLLKVRRRARARTFTLRFARARLLRLLMIGGLFFTSGLKQEDTRKVWSFRTRPVTRFPRFVESARCELMRVWRCVRRVRCARARYFTGYQRQ